MDKNTVLNVSSNLLKAGVFEHVPPTEFISRLTPWLLSSYFYPSGVKSYQMASNHDASTQAEVAEWAMKIT